MRLFAQFIAPVLIVFIGLQLFVSEKEYHRVIRYVLISAVILSLFAIFQTIFGYQTLFSKENTYEAYRASATFQNANSLAIYLVLTIPHLLYAINREIISKKIGWVSVVIILVGIITTVSRKGMITAWLVIFLYFLLKKQFRKLVFLSIFTIVAITILSGYMLVAQRFSKKELEIQVAGKHALVMAGVDMFKKNPFIGLGYEGYSENFNKYFRRSWYSEPSKFSAHNIYIEVLANYGLLGFLPFMAIFLYPLFISFSNIIKGSLLYSKDLSITCIITIVPFMMNGFYAGGLLKQWSIMMLLFTNIVLLFSLRGNNH
ncbi:O-antigen polymerase [sediment metagenome]|uniref:O-antigen polymerase n=1 Tax=sediment metagenome TaxID=749907 RepID=D9PHY0_9ZZZZ